MKYGYIRVSTQDQKIGRQLETMIKHGVDVDGLDPLTVDSKIFNCIRSGNVFIDKMSGKNADRPQFKDLLSIVRQGDTIVFHELSRMSRSLSDIVTISKALIDSGVNLVFDHEGMDPSTPNGKLMLGVLAVIAETERELISERTKEGLAIAKAKGRLNNRNTKKLKVNDKVLNMVCNAYKKKIIHVPEACRSIEYTTAAGEVKSGVSYPTFKRLYDDWLDNNNSNNKNNTNNNNNNNFNNYYSDDDMLIDMTIDD